MFKIRLRSSIILMIIAIVTVVLGDNVLFATVLLISLIGMMELNRVLKINKLLPGILSYIAGILYYFIIFTNNEEYLMILFIGYLMALMLALVIMFPEFKTEQITMPFFAFFYISVMLSYIYKVRMLDNGAMIVWLIFIGAWGSDTCAYCVGVLFGKHKILPKLSPKKSLEGSIGGIVGAGLLGFLYATIFKINLNSTINTAFGFAIIGAASSVISQLGDFVASAIKRNYDIKDYGRLIPGHGGILDRFDSIIFTAPIVYFLASKL